MSDSSEFSIIPPFKKSPPKMLTKWVSDADKTGDSISNKLGQHYSPDKVSSSELLIDSWSTSPAKSSSSKHATKKQATIEVSDDEKPVKERIETSNRTSLRPPSHFFKSHRRRSKTYSGEEFAANLEKLSQMQQPSEIAYSQKKLSNKQISNLMISTASSSSDSAIKKETNASSIANKSMHHALAQFNSLNNSNRRFLQKKIPFSFFSLFISFYFYA